MLQRIKEIFAYKDMIYSLVRRELRGRYKGSVLGFLWTYINPLCQIIVYSAVFSVIFKVNIEKFYLYLTIGMMPWVFFNTSIQGGSTCIRAQADMVKKIYFPREVIPISYVTSAFVNMLLSFIIVFGVILLSGWGISVSVLPYLPLIMIIEYLLALGIAFVVSAVTVYFRDLEQIVGVLMMAWIYLTPIMYDMDYIPEQLRSLFYINPMTPIIIAYHDILYYRVAPTTQCLLQSGLTSLFFLVLGFGLFRRLDRNFAEEL
ncbi:ABC transporter permease [Candidatus Acetatifactor stercoripullorum]|uniref:ABC transporter permease n=1 Tax=Candidatus Acetatifactor stercoripullorum TaxID=2838414 RepID=UPI00298D7AAA|nr:ABC transporter permease [Candidatus Acetatifactor stercoripullorum]